MRLTPLFLSFLLLSASGILRAQHEDISSVKNKALQRELLKMGREDQRYRGEMVELMGKLSSPEKEVVNKKLKAIVDKQNRIDRKNIRQLEEIIRRYGWPGVGMVGNQASSAALLIVDHAEYAYQKKYLPMIKDAALKREVEPAMAVGLEDRVLMNEGKKQIYGTQLRLNEKTQVLELYPIEDEEGVDARRASVGLPPMTDYLRMFGLEYKAPGKP